MDEPKKNQIRDFLEDNLVTNDPKLIMDNGTRLVWIHDVEQLLKVNGMSPTSASEVELLEERIWGIHNYLNIKGVPRVDPDGNPYSVVGRLFLFEQKLKKEFLDRETELLKSIPH